MKHSSQNNSQAIYEENMKAKFIIRYVINLTKPLLFLVNNIVYTLGTSWSISTLRLYLFYNFRVHSRKCIIWFYQLLLNIVKNRLYNRFKHHLKDYFESYRELVIIWPNMVIIFWVLPFLMFQSLNVFLLVGD